MLDQHLTIADEDRNQTWDDKFFKILSESDLKLLTEDPQQGPDGWPYLITETKTTEKNQNERTDSAQKIFHWLSTRGIGLVVNPSRLPYPDYIFSYGMIWSFRETGFFVKSTHLNLSSDFKLTDNSTVKSGPPTADYLPPYVKQILKNFFADQGVFNPRILMIAPDGVNYDLCFSLESLGNPPEIEHQGILEAIAWFLPPHYSIALVSDVGLPQFESL